MSDLLSELIRAKAQVAGAPAEMADAVVVLARQSVELRDGTVKVFDASGNVRVGGSQGGYADMALDELIAEIATARPALFGREQGKSESDTPPVAPKAKATKAVNSIELAGNPYLPATRNLTLQAMLESREPARASKLKVEAGMTPAYLVDRQ